MNLLPHYLVKDSTFQKVLSHRMRRRRRRRGHSTLRQVLYVRHYIRRHVSSLSLQIRRRTVPYALLRTIPYHTVYIRCERTLTLLYQSTGLF